MTEIGSNNMSLLLIVGIGGILGLTLVIVILVNIFSSKEEEHKKIDG